MVFRKSQKISTASDHYFLSYVKKTTGGGLTPPPAEIGLSIETESWPFLSFDLKLSVYQCQDSYKCRLQRKYLETRFFKGSDQLCKVVELSMQSCGQILEDLFETYETVTRSINPEFERKVDVQTFRNWFFLNY